MAKLNFPDPNITTTFTEAGITWTWNATLGVWSSDDNDGFTETDGDTRYLRKDAAAGVQTVQTTSRTTFNGPLTTGQVTLPGGGGPTNAVQRQEVESMIQGLAPDVPGVGDITSVSAGDGLEGGGSIGAVSLSVGSGDGIVVEADLVKVGEGDGITVTSNAVALTNPVTADVQYTTVASELLPTEPDVNRLVTDKFAEYLSVKDFGALGNGSKDDTDAFEKAIDALATKTGPKKLWIPHGTYRITRQLNIENNGSYNCHGITIEGEGIASPHLEVVGSFGSPECTTLLFDHNANYCLNVKAERFVLKNIELWGSDTRWGGAAVQDGTVACIKIGDSIASRLERVSIHKERGVGVYTYGNAVSTVYDQVSVEYCKGIGFLFGRGGSVECGIVTMNTCRVARTDGSAVMAGNPTESDLSAYRIIQLNCEYFMCGGLKEEESFPVSEYVVRLNGDNHTMIGCAVRGPNGQTGGSSNNTGTLTDGSTAAELVKGVYINGKNNLLLNNRYINVYDAGVVISAASENAKVDGAECRCVSGKYDYAVDVEDGAQGFQIERVGTSQCDSASNVTSTKLKNSNLLAKAETRSLSYTVKGDGLIVQPSANYMALTVNGENGLRVDLGDKETRVYGDLRVESSTDGIVLKSPNNNLWRIQVSNSGTLQVTEI